jgi:hypothetical protein
MNTPEQWAQVAFNAWMCEGRAVAHSGGGPDVVTREKLDAEVAALPAAIARAVHAAMTQEREAAVAEERERCARVAEAVLAAMADEAGHPPCCDRTGERIAAAIREGRWP